MNARAVYYVSGRNRRGDVVSAGPFRTETEARAIGRETRLRSVVVDRVRRPCGACAREPKAIHDVLGCAP